MLLDKTVMASSQFLRSKDWLNCHQMVYVAFLQIFPAPNVGAVNIFDVGTVVVFLFRADFFAAVPACSVAAIRSVVVDVVVDVFPAACRSCFTAVFVASVPIAPFSVVPPVYGAAFQAFVVPAVTCLSFSAALFVYGASVSFFIVCCSSYCWLRSSNFCLSFSSPYFIFCWHCCWRFCTSVSAEVRWDTVVVSVQRFQVALGPALSSSNFQGVVGATVQDAFLAFMWYVADACFCFNIVVVN